MTIIDREYRNRYDKNGNFKCKDKWYKYKCNICGYEGWKVESNMFNRNKCACCEGKVVVVGINDLGTVFPELKRFFIGKDYEKYTKSAHKTAKVRCDLCGKEKYVVIYNLTKCNSIGCECGNSFSYPSKFMMGLLSMLNLKYKTEKLFNWCKFDYNNNIKTGRYDFYFKLNDKEYIVEMDGAWHKRDNNMSGVSLKDTQYIDSEKDRLAKENNIEVIRIDCEKSDFEFIKNNIYNSRLKEILELDKVDWKKVEMFALSNLVKMACDYKKENPNLSTKDIADIMNLSSNTVYDYIVRGSKVGWCDYDSKEEMNRIRKENSEMLRLKQSKSIEMFKNGESIGKFFNAKSIREIYKDLDENNIRAVARGVRKSYKGYTFKYI